MYKIKQKKENKIVFYAISFLVNIIGLMSYFAIHETIFALMVLLCGGEILDIVPVLTNSVVYSVDQSHLFLITTVSTLVPAVIAFLMLFIKKHHADAFAYGISLSCAFDVFLGFVSIFWGIDQSALHLFDFAVAFRYSSLPAVTLIVFSILFIATSLLCTFAYNRFVYVLERK